MIDIPSEPTQEFEDGLWDSLMVLKRRGGLIGFFQFLFNLDISF